MVARFLVLLMLGGLIALPASAAPVDVLDNVLGTNYIITVWEDMPAQNKIHVCTIDIGKGYNDTTYNEFERAILADLGCDTDPAATVSDIIILGVERQ